jgi:hypothetical protein
MTRPLALSINDDGTVTLRCDANAFFAHANQIRQLLTAESEVEPSDGGARPFTDFWGEVFRRGVAPQRRSPWGRDLSEKGAVALAAGYYLTRERGLMAFTCADLQAALATLPTPRQAPGSQLVYLCRRGWLERVRRGAYRLSQRAIERVESVRKLRARPAVAVRSEPALPSIIGLSRFLREVPSSRKWRRTLVVAYFLQEHCGIEAFDHRLLAACFKRARGADAPGSLASLISQQLFKRRGLLERAPKRGSYRLTSAAREDLRREPRIAKADTLHRGGSVSKTG